jgi:hypothetical protein
MGPDGAPSTHSTLSSTSTAPELSATSPGQGRVALWPGDSTASSLPGLRHMKQTHCGRYKAHVYLQSQWLVLPVPSLQQAWECLREVTAYVLRTY